jgi:EAL domain-containing protein (putative c-di-GMP-specific phosphodiesterase class I)
MYRAKAAGRNQCAIFDPAMRDSVRQRVETELALRYALDREELAVHYQPVVDMGTGELRGFEALLRWTHPVLGPMAPLDFIPVAEETGLIVDIGAWVVTEALRQLSVWRSQHGEAARDVYVAVNVSARQLRDPALAQHVAVQLRRFDVPATNLVLEITESAMVADVEVASEPLLAVDALGVRVAVDDFGTGYSSLAHLRRFPVSILKIDRSFVDGIADDPDDGEIVRAVVGMAEALGLALVAEGVETEQQRSLLSLLGVASAQGWLFGRPAPGDQAWVGRPLLAAAPAR